MLIINMGIRNYNFEKYNPEQLEHIAEHLSGSNTKGSHFDKGAFQDAKSLVDYAYEQVQDYNGKRLVKEVNLGRTIGQDCLVELSNLPEGAQVTQEPRGRTGYLVNIVKGANKTPTSQMVIVAGPLREEGKHGFYTIFPGQNAPPFPAAREKLEEMGYHGEELETQVKINNTYREFWKNHGFVADE